MTENNRSQWDVGRFVNTLAYFEVIPFISCLKRLFSGNTKRQQPSQRGGKRLVASGSESCGV